MRDRRSGRPWWIPAGIVAGGVAAVLVGAFVGIGLLRPAEIGGGDVTPTPSASVTTEMASSSTIPSASASPSASAIPAPSPSPASAAIIPNRAIAEVVTDSLNLRSAANASASLLTTMQPGRRLFIIGDPDETDGLRWYRVATIDDGTQCDSDCGLIGFAATPIAEPERWIEEVDLDCPPSPLTAESIAILQPLEALHCYGRDEIVITGTMDLPFEGPYTPYTYTPDWLTSRFTTFMRGAWWIWYRPHPDAGLEPPERGDVVRVTGHFEDPAATSCRASVNPDFFGGEIPDEFEASVDPARVILDCRASFVWTGYEVIGTEDLGPCCGSMPITPEAAWLPSRPTVG